jgi:hypothetical protein
VCLYTDKLYKPQQPCTSLTHISNLKYCDGQQQICSLNYHNGNTITHSDVNDEVRMRIESDDKHTIIQQSLLDAIRKLSTSVVKLP